MDKQETSIGTIDDVVITYAKNVKTTARRLVNLRMYDKWLQEDLVQQGYIGLIEAYARWVKCRKILYNLKTVKAVD